jgi:hypothetical protein
VRYFITLVVLGNATYGHHASLPNVPGDAAAMGALFKAAKFGCRGRGDRRRWPSPEWAITGGPDDQARPRQSVRHQPRRRLQRVGFVSANSGLGTSRPYRSTSCWPCSCSASICASRSRRFRCHAGSSAAGSAAVDGEDGSRIRLTRRTVERRPLVPIAFH